MIVSIQKPAGALKAAVTAVMAVCFFLPYLTPADGFNIIGYFPSWRGAPTTAQLSKLTHIIFAFGSPTAAGGLTPGITNLSQLTASARAQGVKSALAVGGGAYGDGNFPAIAASAALRSAFCTACTSATTTYGLDGIDIDWEYPDAGTQSAGYALLMADLAQALHAKGKFLSAAVTDNDWPGSIPTGSSVLQNVDFLNIMVYDMGNPHSPYSGAVNSLNTWCVTKGLARNKYMLGVPFYANNPAVTTYAAIVAQYPAAGSADGVGGYDYNGIPTIVSKTRLALQQAGGIMIWEIGQDATGQASLLNAIYTTVANAQTRRPLFSATSGSAAAPVITAAGRTLIVLCAADNVSMLTLYSCNGKAVRSFGVRLAKGDNRIALPVQTAGGIYIVKLSGSTGAASGRVVIP